MFETRNGSWYNYNFKFKRLKTADHWMRNYLIDHIVRPVSVVFWQRGSFVSYLPQRWLATAASNYHSPSNCYQYEKLQSSFHITFIVSIQSNLDSWKSFFCFNICIFIFKIWSYVLIKTITFSYENTKNWESVILCAWILPNSSSAMRTRKKI